MNASALLGKASHYLFDSSKLEHELHWKPRHTLDSGIMEVISRIRGGFESLAKMPGNYQHEDFLTIQLKEDDFSLFDAANEKYPDFALVFFEKHK